MKKDILIINYVVIQLFTSRISKDFCRFLQISQQLYTYNKYNYNNFNQYNNYKQSILNYFSADEYNPRAITKHLNPVNPSGLQFPVYPAVSNSQPRLINPESYPLQSGFTPSGSQFPNYPTVSNPDPRLVNPSSNLLPSDFNLVRGSVQIPLREYVVGSDRVGSIFETYPTSPFLRSSNDPNSRNPF